MAENVVVVEGHGEQDAMPRLLGRMGAALGLDATHGWKVWRDAGALKSTATMIACVQDVQRRFPRCSRLLLTADLDDGCPKRAASQLGPPLVALGAPFPIAFVLFHREYETMFVACADQLAGQTIGEGAMARTIRADARTPDDPEGRRDAKTAVASLFENSRRCGYKETIHQALLTARLDLDALRDRQFVGANYSEAGLPCYRTLERALLFLNGAQPKEVYPSVAAPPQT